MPIYEYKCECAPEKIVAKERSILDIEPSYLCNFCGLKMQRYFTQVGVQFKGNGFYKTDNPR